MKVDRASMANSLEIRAPFLDHRVIEFAFSKVPSVQKTTTKNKKIILKKLAQQLLPSEFDFMRKQGFSVPLHNWLEKGDFRDLFNDVLNQSNSIFDNKVVNHLLEGIDKGRSNSERLFALVMFELWRKEFNISI